MIKEVDVDGDGRIDFYGKISCIAIARFRANIEIRADGEKEILVSNPVQSILEMIDGVISKIKGGSNFLQKSKNCSRNNGGNEIQLFFSFLCNVI